MSLFQKFKHDMLKRISVKSKLAALHVSGNESIKGGKKMGNLLNVLRRRKVVIASVLDEEENYFTPSEDFGTEQDSSSSEIDGDTPTYVCEICVETRPLDNSFNVKGCAHFYCIQCIIKYIESKLEDNVTSITCPITRCRGLLDPDFCRDILPSGVFNRWGKALCEYAVPGSEKYYCPYKDCSALLINNVGEGIKQVPCPVCKREFCVQCKVAWHSDLDCKNYKKLAKLGEDAMLVDLATRKRWRQCPQCNYYVEKSSGCWYVRCRCRFAFCYDCGVAASTEHHSYRCANCRRRS